MRGSLFSQQRPAVHTPELAGTGDGITSSCGGKTGWDRLDGGTNMSELWGND